MKHQGLILVLSVIFLLVANLGLWLSRTVYNPQEFSNLVVQTYEEPQVRNAIAAQVVDNTLQTKPLVKQVLADPIQSAIAGILGSQTFKTVLEKFAVKFQNYLTTSNRQDVTIETGQLASFIKTAGTAVSPELGAQIPDVTQQTITLISANSLPNINKCLKPIMELGPIAGIISIGLLAYLFYVSDSRVKLLKKTAIYFLVGILLFGLLVPYFRLLLDGNINSQNAQVIANATYDSFANVLVQQLAVLAAIFAIVGFTGYILERRRMREQG